MLVLAAKKKHKDISADENEGWSAASALGSCNAWLIALTFNDDQIFGIWEILIGWSPLIQYPIWLLWEHSLKTCFMSFIILERCGH